MNCPQCAERQTRVLESRDVDCGAALRRRRECSACSYRFTTYERAEIVSLQVKKQSGFVQAFDPVKLLTGLQRACNKRDIDGERLEALAIEIETELRRAGEAVVDSARIGELALHGLEQLDAVAYMRFASVYRAFESIDGFEEELRRMAAGCEQ